MNNGATHDQAQWYAVRTKPNEEDRAESNLRAWHVETFTPKLKELHTTGYGDRYVTRHLFTRYIFAHFDVDRQLHQINYTRGVQSVVSFGGSPVSIDDKVIDLIKQRIGEDGFVRTDEDFKAGDPVRINSGPMQSIVGVFERKLKDKDRVQILLKTMSFESHLLIDKAMVEKVH